MISFNLWLIRLSLITFAVILLISAYSALFGASDAERAAAQVRAFRKANACPSTGKTTGACQDYIVDHIVPLCWGGADTPANMQWQQKKQSLIKDKFEREACAMKKKYEAIPFPAPLR